MSYQKFKVFEDFLNNKLSELQVEEFEKRLKTDKSFKREYQLHRDLSLLLTQNESHEKLKNILEKTRKLYD